MAHQMLASQLDHVEIAIAEVHSVGEQSREHAISMLGGEREDE